MQIEIERKFLFHPRDAVALHGLMMGFGARSIMIRQFFLKKIRYRCEDGVSKIEEKDKIDFPAKYVISVERASPISNGVFEAGYAKSDKRSMKLRMQHNRFPAGQDFSKAHTFVLDFYLVEQNKAKTTLFDRYRVYAIVGEAEVLWKPDSKKVDLDFRAPMAFRPFVLREIDAGSALASQFTGRKLSNSPSSIDEIDDIYQGLA